MRSSPFQLSIKCDLGSETRFQNNKLYITHGILAFKKMTQIKFSNVFHFGPHYVKCILLQDKFLSIEAM